MNEGESQESTDKNRPRAESVSIKLRWASGSAVTSPLAGVLADLMVQ